MLTCTASSRLFVHKKQFAWLVPQFFLRKLSCTSASLLMSLSFNAVDSFQLHDVMPQAEDVSVASLSRKSLYIAVCCIVVSLESI